MKNKLRNTLKKLVFLMFGALLSYLIMISGFALHAQTTAVIPGGRPKYEEVFSRFFFGEKTYNMQESLDHSRINQNIYTLNDSVGIGTLHPSQKLTVNGNILVTGDVCTSDGKCLNAMN